MKQHRFFCTWKEQEGEIVISEKEIVHQMRDVLHLQAGERVILCAGDGKETEAEVLQTEKTGILMQKIEERENVHEPKRRLVLYFSILKRENTEWIVQKATEVGVAELIPIISNRTVKLGIKRERLQEIAKEAAEQSGRGRIPLIHGQTTFEEALTAAQKNKVNFFFHTEGLPPLSSAKIPDESVGLFIGPEGGWDEEEIEMAKKAGCALVSLGSLVLRGETAATIATYLAAQA